MTTIVAQGAEDPLLRINHTGHAGNPALRFEQDAADKAYVWWDSAHNLLNLGTPTTNPILSLQDNGRVGIGTLTPYVKLQVAGGGVATDSFFAFSHVQSVAPPWSVYINAPRNDTLALSTAGRERVTIDNRGWVGIGIGTRNPPLTPLHVMYPVGEAPTIAPTFLAVRGLGPAAEFQGDVHITGSLRVEGPIDKQGGGFKIDHPLDPANKSLSHSFVESPDMKNIYDGVTVLNERGDAVVELPDWFEALNRDFRYQLTAVGVPAPNLHVAEEVA